MTEQEKMERITKLLKQNPEKESSTDHLRLDEYKKHPRYSCAYCDKTHAAVNCIYKNAPVKTETKKETTYDDDAKYSWYG